MLEVKSHTDVKSSKKLQNCSNIDDQLDVMFEPKLWWVNNKGVCKI